MTKKKSKGRGKGRDETRPVRQKKDSGNGKIAQKALKDPFDTLNKGKSFVVEGADKPAGGVTVRENVRRLGYELGLRSNRKFRVSPVEKGKCTVTRIK